MAREIRISVDDDEVFERMKRRKDELELSWEEVLRRGLRETGPGVGVPFAGGHPTPFDEDFGEHIKQQVQQSLRQSLGEGAIAETAESPADSTRPDPADPQESPGRSWASSGNGFEGGIDVEIDRLADAEDAVLAFDFIEADGAEVPLRVNLRTGLEGLAVEVVAVRRGKGTEGKNVFPAGARKTVTSRLAQGDSAILRFGPEEAYPVTPELVWGRDSDGRPTVTDVEILEVHLNNDA